MPSTKVNYILWPMKQLNSKDVLVSRLHRIKDCTGTPDCLHNHRGHCKWAYQVHHYHRHRATHKDGNRGQVSTSNIIHVMNTMQACNWHVFLQVACSFAVRAEYSGTSASHEAYVVLHCWHFLQEVHSYSGREWSPADDQYAKRYHCVFLSCHSPAFKMLYQQSWLRESSPVPVSPHLYLKHRITRLVKCREQTKKYPQTQIFSELSSLPQVTLLEAGSPHSNLI